ncbi:hypothetical protein C8R42DRAFT_648044 [Lentinula raphanica]|nr:hypothetical protein C8R42DRAFT_648044 [Lentinula raphanica]
MPSQKRTSKKLKPSQTVQKKARMSSQDHSQPQKPKPPVIIRSDTESSTPALHLMKKHHRQRGKVQCGSSDQDPMDKVGRWAICSIDAFLNVQAIEATKLESLENDFEPVDADKLFLKAWDQLVAVAPVIEKLLKKAHTEKGQLKYADPLNKISRSILRQYHTSVIRREIIDFISFDDEPLAKHPKSLRGINHPATLRLIIPHRYRDKVDDLESVQKLQNGSTTIRATDRPAFLYNEEQVNDDNIEDGLFTGPIVLQHGMRKVTRRNIAYVQNRFALSAVEKWNIPDGHSDYQVFYNEIVDFFEEYPEDKQSVLTLNFWNKEVFGRKDGLASRCLSLVVSVSEIVFQDAGLKTADANTSDLLLLILIVSPSAFIPPAVYLPLWPG